MMRGGYYSVRTFRCSTKTRRKPDENIVRRSIDNTGGSSYVPEDGTYAESGVPFDVDRQRILHHRGLDKLKIFHVVLRLRDQG